MKLSVSIQGYFEAKRAERLSPNTLRDYAGILAHFQDVMGEDYPIEAISVKDVRCYLASLTVSKKRVKNVYITLSSLWTWAVRDGICDVHILKLISPPKPEIKPIVPFQKREIVAMLEAVKYSLPYLRQGKPSSQFKLANEHRDRAIILFL